MTESFVLLQDLPASPAAIDVGCHSEDYVLFKLTLLIANEDLHGRVGGAV